MRLSARALLALILVGTIIPAIASPQMIGLAAANGSFHVNTTEARGNATLFQGAVVETTKTPSQIRLYNGSQVRLATNSRAKVYEQYVVLEKGSGQLESSTAFPIEGLSLRIAAAEPGTIARVQLTDDGKLLVTVMKGSVHVAKAGGAAVANMGNGESMAFDPKAAAAEQAKIAGCVFEMDARGFDDAKHYVYDAMAKVAVEVAGMGVEQMVGKNVAITGVQDKSTQAIAVTDVQQVAGGNCVKFARAAQIAGAGAAGAAGAGAAAATAAAGAAAAGAAAGAAVGVAATVIGGVAVGATAAGLGAAGTFSGGQGPKTTSP